MKPTHIRYLVLAWMCLFAMIAYVHRSCLAVPARLIASQAGLSEMEMSHVLSIFFWGYALFQLPGGWLGDRYGSRLVVTLIILVSSLANGLTALGALAAVLLAGRFLMGAAQAGLFPCAVLTFGRWFPAAERAFPSGMLASFMSVGAVLASALTGFLLESLSWQEVLFLFSIPGVVLAFVYYFWFRDVPAEHAWVNDAELAWIQGSAAASPTGRGPTPWRRLCSSRPLFWLCTQQFFRAAGYIFYVTWFPTFLQETHRRSIADSGYLTSCPLIGVVLGSAVGGLCTDFLYRRTMSKRISRKWFAVVSLSGSAMLFLQAYLVEDWIGSVALITAGAFCAALSASASYTATIDLGGQHTGVVFSMMNMAGNLGAAIFPVVLAQVAVRLSWSEALLCMAGVYVLAVVSWLPLNSSARLDSSLP